MAFNLRWLNIFHKQIVVVFVFLMPPSIFANGSEWLLNPVDQHPGSLTAPERDYVSYISPAKKTSIIDWIYALEDHGIKVEANVIQQLEANPSLEWLKEVASVYAKYVDQGVLNKKHAQPSWRIDDYPSIPHGMVDGSKLASIESRIPEYQVFKKALIKLKQWVHSAKELFPNRLVLAKGQQHTSVTYLNQWLYDLGLDDIPVNTTYSGALEQAIRRIQGDAGLPVDGRFGASTKALLKDITHQRIQALKVNMERMRWLPRSLPFPHVRVDIAGFKVAWVKGYQQEEHYRAIMGKADKMTPIFQDSIEGVTINPSWTVPHSIASTALLEAEQHNPGFLARENFDVFESWVQDAQHVDSDTVDWLKITPDIFPFKLQQRPGVQNRLGRFKLHSPNAFSVFLHDTNQPALFRRKTRTFSAGCTRVENIDLLVDNLLQAQPNYHPEDAVHPSLKTKEIDWDVPIPIYFVYFTAWPDGNGRMHYRRDIYDFDDRVVNLL